MSRRDAHFDAMLRNLGATYYNTTKGNGGTADVSRALESVTAEDERLRGGGHEVAAHPIRAPHHGRWRVGDVMTTQVVTVTKDARYKHVVRLMTEHKVNAMPVVDRDGHVLGMVSEADVLRKQEENFRRFGTGLPRRTRREREQARARSAGELMTSPAITIHPEAPLGAAARLMNGNNIRRIPVVDEAGRLIGIVSRRDLLSVFLRSDAEIAGEIREAISTILLDDVDGLSVTVRHGVATLSGTLARKDLTPVAVRLASDVDGVVTVVDKLGARATPAAAS